MQVIDFSAINIMGVINTTPDSFSDGGRYLDCDSAVDHARRLIDEGADILDIGGESTRPGADEVDAREELDRTLPIIEAIRQFSEIPISIDTSKAEVMRRAADAGASMINDVWALRRPGSLEAAAESGLPVCLMHMQGDPGSMQQDPNYENVVAEVKRFLRERVFAAMQAGIDERRLIVDPGFGFGKTLQHNLQLLNNLQELSVLGYPLLVGLSRKSMIGQILDKPVDQRLFGSVSCAVIAALAGASIIRVHDVAATRDAVAVVDALNQAS